MQVTSGTGSQARWGGTTTLRAQGRRHSSGLAQGVRCGCRKAPRMAGQGQTRALGCREQLHKRHLAQQPLGPLGAGLPVRRLQHQGAGSRGRQAVPLARSALGRSLADIPGGLDHCATREPKGKH
ncbi:unnamed protein product [Rangifer tarandus platyrhynchus]|uniref:Uncharacterized protein n=2 Tax=Rangifer tarandus platyrhynchus TaxID=3082113 RepID=A0ABN8ZFY8_RANTA|nr:unnamed protein product [Rangifer tarandus platyrhynchus]CAI9706039.1 unnamed protein product [Rangifer tarandus platyrhynchus]